MPASERFQPIKYKIKGKGFQVPNKCPYCKVFHTTIELTPLAPWLRFNYQACQKCKVNRHKTEQGEGYEPYGSKKRRAVNG
jgi:hypothetical protein